MKCKRSGNNLRRCNELESSFDKNGGFELIALVNTKSGESQAVLRAQASRKNLNYCPFCGGSVKPC